tara:strand:- start:2685 stop:3521 length:837 start_codon:yes stop_codon:yes gene_type:complete
MNICFIADYFADEIPGGGELNNQEFINIAQSRSHSIKQIKSINANVRYLESLVNHKFIVANFIQLPKNSIEFLLNKNYVIYEHDHKYLKSRNPATYEKFLAPKEEIINYDFYQNAKAVFCQSTFHADIVRDNLQLDNIHNLSGNLWAAKTLDFIQQLSTGNKEDICAVMDSPIGHKNASGAIRYCVVKGLEYRLIPPLSYYDFLREMSRYDKFIFFPKTPETLARVVVEARMLGMKTINNQLVGATKEQWFDLKGKGLIDHMREKRNSIVDLVLEKVK